MTPCPVAAAVAALAVLCGCLLLLLPVLSILPVPAAAAAAGPHRCIHDEINGRRAARAIEQHKRVALRAAPAGGCPAPEVSARDQFQALRINITYIDMGTYFKNATILQVIRTQVASVVKQLSAMLAVYPVNGTLVLPQLTTCSNPSSPSGCPQQCGLNPLFTIPDWYFESSNSSGGSSRGIPEADIVIFVSGSTSSYCTSVLAYTTVCMRNDVGRPIAAAIQLCPLPFNDLKEDFMYQVILHEMLHALVFSRGSFDVFVDNTSDTCAKYHNPVKNNLEVLKLVTPATLKTASNYFSCINPSSQFNEYGGPLYSIIGPDNLIGSHWNQTQMQGSLMTAVIPQARVVSLDIITLAVFEDSGWYIVNYSFAQPFVFGQHAGCSFGSADYCKSDTQYYCNQLNTIGCHYLHRDKGTCSKFDPTSSCYSYIVGPQTACYDPQNPSAVNASLTGESYDITSRCFMSSLWPVDKVSSTHRREGRCYQHTCNGSSLLLRAWNMTDWLACPYNTTIQVPGYAGVIQCPISGILCSNVDTVASMTAVSLPTSATTWTSAAPGSTSSSSQAGDGGAELLTLVFHMLNLTGLQQPDAAATFRDAVSAAISLLANISSARLVSSNVTHAPNGNDTYYTCYVVDPAADSPHDISAAEAVKLIYVAVAAGQFNVTIWSTTYVASLPDTSSTTQWSTTQSQPRVVARSSAAPTAIGVALGVAAVVVALVVTCVCLQRRQRRLHRASVATASLVSSGTTTTMCELSVIDVPAAAAVGRRDPRSDPRC